MVCAIGQKSIVLFKAVVVAVEEVLAVKFYEG
jgi:hypothetical protein